jgi:murein DD-endopeptidase MepM/ murein hydrolase activator NlpD
MPRLQWPIAGATRASLNSADKPGEGRGEFGTPRSRGSHGGIDIQAAAGTTVVAAGAGTVVPISPNPSSTLGEQIVIRHTGNIYTHYAHLAIGSSLVRSGDTVTAGQAIAQVGRSGNTPRQGDTHLHFEVRLNSPRPRSAGGTVVDPLDYLP